MKKITCEELGGEKGCTEEFTGSAPEEIVAKGWAHIATAHPDMAETIKNNPKEVNDKWQEEFRARFEALPAA